MRTTRFGAAAAALLLAGCASDGGTHQAEAASVRVLVELAIPAGAPPQTAISEAQTAVIAALPPGTRVVRRYDTLPMLALEVSPAALPGLLQIPQVKAVQPDRERGGLGVE